MSELTIEAMHIRLVLQTPAEVLARIDALAPSERAEVSADWLARVRASTVADQWTHGFSVVDRGTGAVVGSCGYKGPPDPAGIVEIAYGIDQGSQGRGYATEAARALVDFAFASGHVHLVRAHTRPGNSASTRVLTKCGFERAGEVVDPEDGLVWRWEIRRARRPRACAGAGSDADRDARRRAAAGRRFAAHDRRRDPAPPFADLTRCPGEVWPRATVQASKACATTRRAVSELTRTPPALRQRAIGSRASWT